MKTARLLVGALAAAGTAGAHGRGARIIGGSPVTSLTMPWLVSVQDYLPAEVLGQEQYSHFCGGALISPEWVLTAAHCLEDTSTTLYVLLNVTSLSRLSSNDGIRARALQVVVHPGYDSDTLRNDIGLIRIAPVKGVQPIKIRKSTEKTDVGTEAVVAGWGLVHMNELNYTTPVDEYSCLKCNVPCSSPTRCLNGFFGCDETICQDELVRQLSFKSCSLCGMACGQGLCSFGKSCTCGRNDYSCYVPECTEAARTGGEPLYRVGPKQLREVAVPITSHSSCVAAYGNINDDTQVCAGYPEGGKDSCQGDSGGPLFLKVGEDFEQIGVVSFGEDCAAPGFPGVYTRVNAFQSWISDYAEIDGSDSVGLYVAIAGAVVFLCGVIAAGAYVMRKPRPSAAGQPVTTAVSNPALYAGQQKLSEP